MRGQFDRALKKKKKERKGKTINTRCHPEASSCSTRKKQSAAIDRSRDQSFRVFRSRDVDRRPRGGGEDRRSDPLREGGKGIAGEGMRLTRVTCTCQSGLQRVIHSRSFSPSRPRRRAFHQVRCTLSHRFSSRPSPTLFARSFPLIPNPI